MKYQSDLDSSDLSIACSNYEQINFQLSTFVKIAERLDRVVTDNQTKMAFA